MTLSSKTLLAKYSGTVVMVISPYRVFSPGGGNEKRDSGVQPETRPDVVVS
jgi:hypothetical protein